MYTFVYRTSLLLFFFSFPAIDILTNSGLSVCRAPHTLTLSHCLALVRCRLNIFGKDSLHMWYGVPLTVSRREAECQCVLLIPLTSWSWYSHRTDALHLCDYPAS